MRPAIRHGLAFLGRHALVVLALGILTGLVWQGGAEILRRGLPELVFLIMVGELSRHCHLARRPA